MVSNQVSRGHSLEKQGEVTSGSVTDPQINMFQNDVMDSEGRSDEEGWNGYQKVTELESGQIFGELALISNKPRAATIHCMTDCHFAVLDRRTFSIIRQLHENLIDHRVGILRKVPFFQKISKIALMKF